MNATQTGDRPTVGLNRPTLLFIVWIGVAISITALAILALMQEGFEEAWVFLMSGLALLWFILRDWFRRQGGEFVTRNNDWWFLGMTIFVLGVVLWVLIDKFVI